MDEAALLVRLWSGLGAGEGGIWKGEGGVWGIWSGSGFMGL